MSTYTVDDRLRAAWEKARRLPDFRKTELVDFIEFLESREDEDDIDAEDAQAVRDMLAGRDRADIPWEDVMRESRELGDRVLD